jgi:HPt (histidine-containing phosphotransfer) domain-containing protein
MARSKTDKALVATYADHEVITPPHNLRKAVSKAPASADDDPVARAEQALARLSGQFAIWMEAQCDRLDQARRALAAEGFTKNSRDALFLAAHDIRGDAETFGYPLVATPAGSLCRLIEHTPDMRRIPLTLVDQHVDAVRAIIRETARPDAEETAAALTRRLCEVTDEFLAHENRDRPDELREIFAPALAPRDPGF